MRFSSFDTEETYDYLTIGGTRYDGDGTTLPSNGVNVSLGDTLSWRSDGSVQEAGFVVCGYVSSNAPTAAPSILPTVPPTVPGQTWAPTL